MATGGIGWWPNAAPDDSAAVPSDSTSSLHASPAPRRAARVVAYDRSTNETHIAVVSLAASSVVDESLALVVGGGAEEQRKAAVLRGEVASWETRTDIQVTPTFYNNIQQEMFVVYNNIQYRKCLLTLYFVTHTGSRDARRVRRGGKADKGRPPVRRRSKLTLIA